MLTPRQRALLAAREDTYFMNWIARWIPRDGLDERERFVLCRDAFRMTVWTLTLLAVLLPLGRILELVVLVAWPNYLFFGRWAAYARSAQAKPVPVRRQSDS